MKNKNISFSASHTKEKIRITKKIGPYFPEEVLPALNKSLIITEKIVKLQETIDFMKLPEDNYIKEAIVVDNPKQRLSYIMNTIRKEVPKQEVQDMGIIMEVILNVDRYKKILNILNSILSNPDILNDPKQMVILIEPFMEGKTKEEKEKLKDMINMLEIMKSLDEPQKENKTKTD